MSHLDLLLLFFVVRAELALPDGVKVVRVVEPSAFDAAGFPRHFWVWFGTADVGVVGDVSFVLACKAFVGFRRLPHYSVFFSHDCSF